MVSCERAIFAVVCLRLPNLDARVAEKIRSLLLGHSWSHATGKSLFFGFATMSAAIGATVCALQTQRAISKPSIGIAVGEGSPEQFDRFEAATLARMLAFEGSEGQVLLARSAYEVALSQLSGGISVQSLGPVLLEGGLNPQGVYQLNIPGRPLKFDPLEGTGEIRSNIDQPPAGFLGREAEQRQLLTMIKQSRTATIVGPGGIGKTALAWFLAYYQTPGYLGGGWLIDFSSVHSDADVAGVVCSDLRVVPKEKHSSLEALREHLSQERTLLVLDNCENLAAPIGKLAEHLLSVENTTVILTSREPLNFKAERPLFLKALTSPPSDSSLRELEDSCGIQLLLRGFDGVNDLPSLACAAQLIDRLGGFPLALQLANSRLHALVVNNSLDEALPQLISELEDSDDDGETDSPNDALDAILGWSFGGLRKAEQDLLLKLSCLDGSWSKSLGVAVAEASGFDRRTGRKTLESLLGSGLIQDEGRSRYRILMPTQEFLHTLLEAYGDSHEASRDRYAQGVLRWVEEQWSVGEGMLGRTLDMLSRETQHILAAIEWLRDRDLRAAVALFNLTYDCWLLRGPYVLASSAAEGLIQALRESNSPDLARLLHQGAMLTGYSGRFGTAIDMATEARELTDATGDTETYKIVSSTLALQLRNCDRRSEARSLLQEILQLTVGDVSVERVRNLVRFASLLVEAGEWDGAEPWMEEALKLNSDLGDLRAMASLASLQHRLFLYRSDTQEALNSMRTAIRLHRQGGNYQGLADGVGAVAYLAKRLGNDLMSARLLGASHHMTSLLSAGRPVDIRSRDAELGANLVEVLGDEQFEREAAIGVAWSLEELINHIESL